MSTYVPPCEHPPEQLRPIRRRGRPTNQAECSCGAIVLALYGRTAAVYPEGTDARTIEVDGL